MELDTGRDGLIYVPARDIEHDHQWSLKGYLSQQSSQRIELPEPSLYGPVIVRSPLGPAEHIGSQLDEIDG